MNDLEDGREHLADSERWVTIANNTARDTTAEPQAIIGAIDQALTRANTHALIGVGRLLDATLQRLEAIGDKIDRKPVGDCPSHSPSTHIGTVTVAAGQPCTYDNDHTGAHRDANGKTWIDTPGLLADPTQVCTCSHLGHDHDFRGCLICACDTYDRSAIINP